MQTDFYKASLDALKKPGLFPQHRKVMDALRLNRNNSVNAAQDFELKRDIAHKLRLDALERLPELLTEFESRAVHNGFQVHWASETDDAVDIILGLLKKMDAKLIIKGKSMVSEEIHLNEVMEEKGYDVVESDLGELIVQVAQEHPSHIIAPAVHKNVREIASLFHTELGMEYSETIDDLIAFARKYMREKFYRADVGITGVNFAVSETGTLCLVENEGNGRFTSTLPKYHIALMSLDKILPKMTDLHLILELLTKSATGQKITSYVNMISGPRRSHELDGPEEAHIVIIDNNRTKMLKDELLRKTLLCIRCGACMNACPIYVNIGGHAYNSTIPGPIGKILMPQIQGMDKHGVLPTSSSLCGACVDVCPVKIPITEILLKLRSTKVEQEATQKESFKSPARRERLIWNVWSFFLSRPQLYQIQRKFLGYSGNFTFAVKPLMKRWLKFRAYPEFSKQTLNELAKKEGFYENK